MVDICRVCGKESTAPDAHFCPYCGAALGMKDAGEVCGKLYAVYDEYIGWSNSFLSGRGAGSTIAAMFSGDRDFKDRPEHKRFFDDCGKAAGELYELFSAGECDRAAVLKILDHALLNCHKKCMDAAEWMLLAAEKHFLPFVELLSSEEAAALYEPYRRLRRKNRGLPPQDEMLKKLKKQRA